MFALMPIFLAVAVTAQVSQWQPAPSGPAVNPTTAGHPWAMRHANPRRTGQSSFPGATLAQVEWSFRIAGQVPEIAIGLDGSVHLGSVWHSEFWSQEQYVYVLDSTGKLRWRLKVRPYDWGMGQGVPSSPALTRSGDAIVPSTFGQLLRLGSQGDAKWTYQANGNASNLSSPAVLPDGSTRGYLTNWGLVSLSPTGTQNWLSAGASTRSSSVAVAANGEMALSGVRSTQPHGFPALHYFNADGTLRGLRSTTLGEDSTPLIGPDGTVYAQYLGTAAFRPDNTIVWQTSISGHTRALSTGNKLYVAESSRIHSFDAATGVPGATLALPGPVNPGLAIDLNGKLYATTSNGWLCAFLATGATLFQAQICTEFTTGPAIGNHGNVVAAGLQSFTPHVFSVR